MQESCPACGGSTRVGTSELRREVEKSRSRAIGASKAISCGVVQVGGRRVPETCSQRARSGTNGPHSHAATTPSVRPSVTAAHACSQLPSSPLVGGKSIRLLDVVAIRSLSWAGNTTIDRHKQKSTGELQIGR